VHNVGGEPPSLSLRARSTGSGSNDSITIGSK